MAPDELDPYQELESNERSPSLEQREHKLVHNGQLVEELIRSEVWQEIVGPQLHDMISGSIGFQKKDGRWLQGHWAKSRLPDNERIFSAGYSSGLMEFSNSMLDFIREKDKVVQNRKSRKQNQKMVRPMEEE